MILTLGYTQPDEESSVLTLSSAAIKVTCIDEPTFINGERIVTYSYITRRGEVINLK